MTENQKFDIDSLDMQEVINDVEEFLVKFSMTYKMSPLNISGVLLARLLRINQEVGSENDFIQLLYKVIEGVKNQVYTDKPTLQ